MKGGFLDSIGSTLSGWGTSISDSATGAWNKTKTATTGAYDSTVGSSQPAIVQPSSTSYTSGGKKSRKTKRGGYSANSSVNNLASHASSFSGSTAKPHTYVGGRKTKRRHRKHKHTKSCRHKKH